MQTDNRPRCAVLGLDGLPFSLAESLCARGLLPNLAALVFSESGKARPIRAELPELSPTNWTSFATAQGPEGHGIFGFTRISGADYSISLTDASQVAAPTLFDRLGERGLTSKVINLPNTYPARPIRGMLIAGFVAPELSRAVHPRFLAGPLRDIGYRLEADTERGLTDPDGLLGDLRETLDARGRALDLLWPDLAWDLFVFVLTETDRLFHFLYDAVEDPAHPRHDACMSFLAHWDRHIGRFAERWHALPGPKRLTVLADHGFTRLRTEVDINARLRDNGFLRVPAAEGPGGEFRLDTVGPDTTAFALDPGRVYLHRADRFSRGSVRDADIPALSERIAESLLALRWQGEPVIRAVHRAAELYPGPMLHAAPDLVCEPVPGFDLKAKFNRREIFGFFNRTGTHTADNALFFDSDDDGSAKSVRHAGQAVLDFFDKRGSGIIV